MRVFYVSPLCNASVSSRRNCFVTFRKQEPRVTRDESRFRSSLSQPRLLINHNLGRIFLEITSSWKNCPPLPRTRVSNRDISYLKWNRNRSANLLARAVISPSSPAYVFFCMNLQFFPARNRPDFSKVGRIEQTSLLRSQFHPDAPETTVIFQKTLFPGAKVERR